MIKQELNKQEVKISKIQPVIGIILLLLIALLGNYVFKNGGGLTLNLITGAVLGYIFTRSRFGFAGGIKRLYMTGEGSLTKALLIMFAISTVAATGIHWAAAAKGAVPVFMAGLGQAVIPGTGSVGVINIALIVGGFLFGAGMMIAGGCASGTLTDAGEGSVRALIVMLFFGIGGIIGLIVKPAFTATALGKIGTRVYLPNTFGYIGAVLVTFALLLVLYAITRKYEDIRRNKGTYEEIVYEADELSLKEEGQFKLFSYSTYHKFFVERWSFLKGAILTSVMFIFIINTTGNSWGVSGGYPLWVMAILDKLGIEFTAPALAGNVKAIGNGLLKHGVTLRNLGMIAGSAIAFLLAGRFKLDYRFSVKDVVFYVIGGLLLGFGAMFAGGCNIGALYSAISNFSLSGWIYLLAASLGGIVSLKLFEGKVDTVPARFKK
ncbi:MAG: YeeE/YedE family protein [Tissierellales bacterium]